MSDRIFSFENNQIDLNLLCWAGTGQARARLRLAQCRAVSEQLTDC